jgi:hypothetical protein
MRPFQRTTKQRFAKLYVQYRNQVAALNYDCGTAMLYQLRPELEEMARQINALAEELRKPDPEFPPSWTPLYVSSPSPIMQDAA